MEFLGAVIGGRRRVRSYSVKAARLRRCYCTFLAIISGCEARGMERVLLNDFVGWFYLRLLNFLALNENAEQEQESIATEAGQ